MTVRIEWNQQALRDLLESKDGPVAQELARRAVKVEAAAKRACPVDTGRLRSSIHWQIDRDQIGLHAVIGTNVAYALHVEVGTRFMAAQPFLRPALGAAR